ncbi:MAG: hypothetical protein MO852_04685 [Candidatus Devosia euplotis]|nr:hypothetical protein [Candidatus Devosia euplotis]
MTLRNIGLLVGIALGAMAMAAPAMAQTVIKVWSIDGVDRPGIADTFSKEFNDKGGDITIDYRGI